MILILIQYNLLIDSFKINDLFIYLSIIITILSQLINFIAKLENKKLYNERYQIKHMYSHI